MKEKTKDGLIYVGLVIGYVVCKIGALACKKAIDEKKGD